jgi:hypothetical protein
MNLSALFTAYNQAKWYAKRTGEFDVGNVDRALGLLMAHRLDEKRGEYNFDFRHCDCPDATIRKRVCKHQIALQIQAKHDRIMEGFWHG